MTEKFDINEYIMHHITDGHEWHIPFLLPIHLPSFLTLHGLMLLIGSFLLILLFCVVYNKKETIPTGMTNLLESFVVFIRDEISIACLGEEYGRKLTPLFCNFFFFVLVLNLLGIIPLFASATSNVNVTGGLAFITLTLMTVGTIYKNGVGGFFKALIPSGVPIPILVILVPIEFLGIFIKCFALMIRLFANMLAGHIIIFSLLSLVVVYGYFALPAVGLALAIDLFEIFVSLLQAYIFTLLSAVFVGLMFESHH